jgi:hypothetical protein
MNQKTKTFFSFFRNEKFLRSHESKHLTGEVLMPGEVLLFKCPVVVDGAQTTCDKVKRKTFQRKTDKRNIDARETIERKTNKRK